MKLFIGTITSVKKRFLDVKLHHSGQTIENVVITAPLDLDEREEQIQINNATEVLVAIDDVFGIAFALASTNQGISIADNATSIIRNQKIKLFGDEHLYSGDNEAIASKIRLYSSKIALQNDTAELVSLLKDLANEVKTLSGAVAGTTPTSGSSAGSSNAQAGTANGVGSSVGTIISKISTFIG